MNEPNWDTSAYSYEEMNPPQVNWLRIGLLAGGAALALFGIARRSGIGIALAAVGSSLIFEGAAGQPMWHRMQQMMGSNRSVNPAVVIPLGQGIRVEESIIVDKPRAEIYRFWRDFENLPRLMEHLDQVQVMDGKRSHWKAKAPVGMKVEWDAEIINDIENELIAWKSLDGSEIKTAGSVHFEEMPGMNGTQVRVNLKYDPPAGKLGIAFAKMFREHPERQIKDDLQKLKSVMEAYHIPVREGY